MEIKNPITAFITNYNYNIMYVKKVDNEDGSCNLYFTDKEDGEKCLVVLLDDGQLVFTNIGG